MLHLIAGCSTPYRWQGRACALARSAMTWSADAWAVVFERQTGSTGVGWGSEAPLTHLHALHSYSYILTRRSLGRIDSMLPKSGTEPAITPISASSS